MRTEIKSISDPQLNLEILSTEDIQRIHEATLSVIEKTGVRFPSTRALDLWVEHGATIDRDRQVARVPARVIEAALSTAPSDYVLAARSQDQDLYLDGNHVYVGTDGCGVEVIDLYSGERRGSTIQDVRDIAVVADYLPEVAFHWVAVSAQDRPVESRSLHELHAIWLNSTKHVQTESIYSVAEAKAAVEMATAIAGGAAELRERPVLSIMQCTLPPLGQDGGSIDAALIAAQAGLPVGFMTMTSSGSTAPVTLAGNLVVGNAEVISALALIQLAYPGAPVFYAAAQTSMDLRSGGYTGGGPEDFLFGAATNKLADFYNVPLSMGSFATGAKKPDWQAGVDNSMSTFMASVVMSDMLLGVGLLHGSRIWSFAQMLMDCEIFDMIWHMMKGIEVSEQTIALDVIDAVGPAGNYLTQKHTKHNMGNLWVPKYMDRRTYNEWEQRQDGAEQWATAEAQRILENHQPETLDAALSDELLTMIASIESG
ncbi:MAG TPA: trimethylamine methyltransferase family protein [candidate division Zixibacteria bacterium]|nr:trimethylamine methyltransferase family protein [candidate division Zixibacteria bacterium]